MDTLYTVKYKRIDIPMLSEKVPIWFFGDVHRDARSCDVERWKWFLKRAKDDDGAYFFGMGDYHDFASTKEKKKLQSGDLHETTMQRFDEIVERDNRRFAMECGFMRGRMLGMIGGNHGWKFSSGKLADEDLSERLETEYLGWLCHYTIAFHDTTSNRSKNIHLVLCHGKAGGKTFGVTINQVGDLKSIFPMADIYCMGHDHQRTAHPVSILHPEYMTGGVRIKQMRQFLCRSGSFKRAYVEGESSYEVGRLLRPADLGALRLEVSFHRDRRNGDDFLVTDITAEI